MDINKVFPSRYLKAADLNGRDVTVAIKSVKLENVGQGQQSKPVAYFKGTDKGLILNVTNSKRIALQVGSNDTDKWTGAKITLYVTETDFQGDTVDCIRVRVPRKATDAAPPDRPAKKSAKAKKAVEPEPDDDIPEPSDSVEPPEEDFDPDDADIPF